MIYIFVLWSIRGNKDNGSKPVRQSQSQSENLSLRSKEADYEWANSGREGMQNAYVLFTVLAPSSIAEATMSEVFNRTESLHSDIEIKSYENNSSTLGVRIVLKPVEKVIVDSLLNRVVGVAWTNGGELLSVNILNSDT